jgi:hypothetical protein
MQAWFDHRLGKSMFFEPACKEAGDYGYSVWPTQIPHWWMSLGAADQGAWAAGLGALAAAFAALYISQKDQRRRDRETSRKQRIVASYHFTHMAYLARDAAFLHLELIRFSTRTMEQVSNESIATYRQLIKEMQGIIRRTKVGEISQLPSDVGESVGFAMGGYNFVTGELDSTLASLEAQTRNFHDLQVELRDRALQLDNPVDSTVKFIQWFQKEFKMKNDVRIVQLLRGI